MTLVSVGNYGDLLQTSEEAVNVVIFPRLKSIIN